MAKPRAGYHDVFAQIPKPLWEAMNAEALANLRNATAQLIWILRERYPDAAVAPTETAAQPAKGKPKKAGGKG
jgi:hypothetical protein